MTDKTEWHRYYSEKRIRHQWLQLHLISEYHRGGQILEIGPAYGLVTAMLRNASYDVITLGIDEKQFTFPDTGHIICDLLNIKHDQLPDVDTVLCCETLEHLPWDNLDHVLKALHRRGRILITSVPYEGMQFFFEMYMNFHFFKKHTQFRKLKSLKSFTPEADPMGHKWEVGYRCYPLRKWEKKLAGNGWKLLERKFTSPTRSVFHVLVAV